MHMGSECSLTSRFSRHYTALSQARIRLIQSTLVIAQSYYLKEQCSLLTPALERKFCILDVVSASPSMLMLWHFWCSDKRKQQQSSAVRHHTVHLYNGTNTGRQGHAASLKPRWKCAAQRWQQREFTACKSKRLFYYASHEWEWGGARSLSPKCNVSLSASLSPSVTYSENCSAAVCSANAELQLFPTAGLRLHTKCIHDWLEVFQMTLGFSGIEKDEKKKRYLKLCCWAYQKYSTILNLDNHILLEWLLCNHPISKIQHTDWFGY